MPGPRPGSLDRLYVSRAARRAGRILAGSASVVALLGLIVVWQFATVMLRIPDYFLPQPIKLAERIASNANYLVAAAIPLVRDASLGFIVGNGSAVALALLTLRVNLVRGPLTVVALALQGVPIVAIAPLITLIAGYGTGAVVAIVSLVCFFPMFVSALRGLSAVDRRLRELSVLYDADAWTFARKVRLPSAAPYLFAGLRITAPGALGGAILGEFLASNSGLGYLILSKSATADYVTMWEATTVATVIVMIVFAGVVLVERLLVPWARP